MKIKLAIASILDFLGFKPKNTIQPEDVDVTKGFQIDEPNLFVRWGIGEKALTNIFSGHEFKRINDGYYVVSCSCLNGLNCMLGFHFFPRNNGVLTKLEFFRTNYSNQQQSFDEFQSHFEKSFGKPTSVSDGEEGFKSYMWRFNNVQIIHGVINRFGPEEHMFIEKKSRLF